MEASRHLPENSPPVVPVEPFSVYDGGGENDPLGPDINVLGEYNDQGELVAHHFHAGGQHLGVTATLEVTDPRDGEYTYHFWFGDENFGDVEICADDTTVHIDWAGVPEGLKPEDTEKCTRMLAAAMFMLPLALQRDFPEAAFLDSSGREEVV